MSDLSKVGMSALPLLHGDSPPPRRRTNAGRTADDECTRARSLGVVRRVLDGRMLLRTAAEVMGITTRQARRLCRAYKAEGAKGLVSKARGRASNRKITEDVQKRAVELVRERYVDFGPTLAAEKLAELHGIAVSRETLRHWMKSDGAVAHAERSGADAAPATLSPGMGCSQPSI